MEKRKANQRLAKSVSRTADRESPDAYDLLERDLSPRQREVVVLLAEGHTNKQIAAILHLSTRTVEAYRANVMRKLKLRSFPGLVRYAVRKLAVQLQPSEKSTLINEGRDISREPLAVEASGARRYALGISDEFERLRSRFQAIQKRFEKAQTPKERQELLASSEAILLKAHLLVAELRVKPRAKKRKKPAGASR
jgi:DNA-binding CsgD family transcriptional regulator